MEYLDASHKIGGLTLLPGFLTSEEQEELAQELDAGFKSKRYSFTQHWDRVIIGYREYERSTLKFSQRNQRLIRRLTEAVGPDAKLFPRVHVLDIHEVGNPRKEDAFCC